MAARPCEQQSEGRGANQAAEKVALAPPKVRGGTGGKLARGIRPHSKRATSTQANGHKVGSRAAGG